MKAKTISLVLAGLFAAAAAPIAQAQLKVSGSVTAGALGTSENSGNAFRLHEYRDLKGGAVVGVELRGETDTDYFVFFGENLGRDDQYAQFRGGTYGFFKYSVERKDIIHNLTFNAITPYRGIGSNFLTLGAAPASIVTSTWTPFDYSIKHENSGAAFELSMNSPWYFRANANQKQTQGIRPMGFGLTTGGGPGVELPVPVNYTTTDFAAEGGYSTRTTQYSVNFSHSSFRDHIDFVTWQHPGVTAGPNLERSTTSADNELWKLAANALWKQLPMESALALRGTYSKLSNSLPVEQGFLTANLTTGVGTAQTSGPSTGTFNGEIIDKTLSASLTSQPTRALDSRLYWNWTKKENHSTHVTFTPSTATAACDYNNVTKTVLATCSNHLFEYRKHNVGAELRYRVNPQNRIGGGLDYTDIKRERFDSDDTEDMKLFVEWKNSTFELASGKIKYQRLQRRSNFLLANYGLPAQIQSIERYIARFDVADVDQDSLKLVVDSSPAPFVELGGEIILKNNDYKNTLIGRTKDTRQELYLTASFGDPKRFRLSAFFDVEATRYDSFHRAADTGSCAAGCSPFDPNSAANYNWTARVKDKNYVVGLGADWPYSERLKFKGALTYQDTDGTVDFASLRTPLIPLQSIPNFDSFTKRALNLKGIYALDKNFDLTVGFAHERYRYSDLSFDGYRYTLGGATARNYYSGAYAFPNYNANIGYFTLTYKLQ